MKYLFRKQIREQRQLRESFMDLAVRTFDLSFESWYRAGFWTEKYIPYIFAEKNKVVANASVNIMDTAAGRLAKINAAENDERLFILGENLFSDHQIRFPVLSHA